MSKSKNYKPLLFFTILGAVLITVLVLLGRKESYTAGAYKGYESNEDDDDDDTVENFSNITAMNYATNSCIDKFSRYYDKYPKLYYKL